MSEIISTSHARSRAWLADLNDLPAAAEVAQETVIVLSGVHSGPDPSGGLGIARSLRAAHPSLWLIAHDYSNRSSGLHDAIFDEVWLGSDFQGEHSNHYLQFLDDRMRTAHFMISSLDTEIDWLARSGQFADKLLHPDKKALSRVQKPAILASAELRMRVPDWIPADGSPAEIERFCVDCGWKVWLKAVHHDAVRVRNMRELEAAYENFAAVWPAANIFVQRHVRGIEKSVVFCAVRGKLIGLAHVDKRDMTDRGKTWTASVSTPSPAVVERVAALVAETGWTGGGEIEHLVDRSGAEWLVDLNPRFPAYIDGVTITGFNMPAMLLEAASAGGDVVGAPRVPRRSGQFTRVVSEIAVRQKFELPPLEMRGRAEPVASKGHPSNQALIAKRIAADADASNLFSPSAAELHVGALGAPWIEGSPERRLDEERLEELLTFVGRCCAVDARATPAMSVKTDPNPRIARAYLERGWMAEAISEAEFRWAVEQGFTPDRIIVNGPLSAYVDVGDASCRYRFLDSAEALEHASRTRREPTVGLRIRPSHVRSRFGIDLSEFDTFRRVAKLLGQEHIRQIALHFHFALDYVSWSDWHMCIEQCAGFGAALEMAAGKSVVAFDLGGGWSDRASPDGTERALRSAFEIVDRRFPALKEIVVEPGKFVASGAYSFATRVVEVRRVGGVCREVVVDRSIADLPMTQFFAHDIVWQGGGGERCRLRGGAARILGSICMETDILARKVSFPKSIAEGDHLVFSNAGAYNRSMAWPFAGGKTRDE